jgi:hypothetical protein
MGEEILIMNYRSDESLIKFFEYKTKTTWDYKIFV